MALVRDQLDLRVTFDVWEELVLFHLTKIGPQANVGLGLQSLLAEKHHAVQPKRLLDLFVNVFGAGGVQVNAADHAADGGRHRVHLDVAKFHFSLLNFFWHTDFIASAASGVRSSSSAS